MLQMMIIFFIDIFNNYFLSILIVLSPECKQKTLTTACHMNQEFITTYSNCGFEFYVTENRGKTVISQIWKNMMCQKLAIHFLLINRGITQLVPWAPTQTSQKMWEHVTCKPDLTTLKSY